MLWVLDLDGVIRLSDQPIDGSADAVARLRAAGHEVVFVTNNAFEPVSEQEAGLAAMGIEAAGAVIGAARAGASLLGAGERVLVVGGPGLVEEVEAAGATVVREAPADAVICGLDRSFDYAKLAAANRAIRGGARFIATNTDPSYPTPDGLEPGGGSLVAAIAAASGVEPIVGGKPHQPIADLIGSRADGDGVVVGDRVDTDGALARRLGFRFALVLSGATGPDDDHGDADLVAPDLAAVVAHQQQANWP